MRNFSLSHGAGTKKIPSFLSRLDGTETFAVDFTKSLVPIVGTGTYTFNGDDGDQIQTDFAGVEHTCKADEVRLQGSRRVCNLLSVNSEDVTTWSTSGTTKIDFESFQTNAGASNFIFAKCENYDAVDQSEHCGSIELKGTPGDVVRLALQGNGPDFNWVTPINITLTADWVRYSTGTILNDGNNWSSGIRIIIINTQTVGGSKIVYARNAQVENVTGQINQLPSEYVSVGQSEEYGSNVDGVKYFDTTNGNTVSNDIVTSGTGKNIHPHTTKGVLIEKLVGAKGAEDLSYNIANYSETGWLECEFEVDQNYLDDNAVSPSIFSIQNNTSSKSFKIYASSSTEIDIVSTESASTSSPTATPVIGHNKICISWEAPSTFRYSLNGESIQENVNANSVIRESSATQFYIGSSFNTVIPTAWANVPIKNIRMGSTLLTANECVDRSK